MKGNLKSVFIIFYFNKIQSSFIELKLEKEKCKEIYLETFILIK
jgi:hypothetical protein